MDSIRKKINLNLDNEIIEILQTLKASQKKDSISDLVNEILKNDKEIKRLLEKTD
jgi:hypothetical protein